MAENVLHPTVDDGSYLDLGIERDDTPAEKQEQDDAEYLEIAKVTIAYSRASEEELNLACGDTIGVLEKEGKLVEGKKYGFWCGRTKWMVSQKNS